jgi:hypothetical protein
MASTVEVKQDKFVVVKLDTGYAKELDAAKLAATKYYKKRRLLRAF